MTLWRCRYCGHTEQQPRFAKEVAHQCRTKRGLVLLTRIEDE